MASGGLSNLLVSLPESSTAQGLKVVVKKPPRKFLFSIQNKHLNQRGKLAVLCLKELCFLCRLTAITQLVHHGMIFVPIGYTFGAGMFEMEKVKGGSPYGAGTFAGDGSRQPTELELEQAFHQGKYIAAISKKLKGPAAAA